MRFRTRPVFGLAMVVVIATGCSAVRRPSGDEWSWKAETPCGASYSQGMPSTYASPPASPDHHTASSAREFDFSNPRVDDFVTKYQTDLRGFFTHALSRSARYVPRMSSILEKEGVPQELAYLPLIESGFRPQAVSRAGAAGPWQFIRGTGRRYGLRIDRYVDERRDPVKSTWAAARYLKDLYAMFGDWHLSLAAYNSGEGTISRILGEAPVENFWQMSDGGYLRAETENFVPRFLAAVQIADEPEAYGFDAPSAEPLRYDLVTVERQLSLAQVAALSGASTRTIKELNPALLRGVLPPRGYAVRLPKGCREAFEAAYARMGRAGGGRLASRSGSGLRTHRVRRGDTLGSIAQRYGVSVKALQRLNRIRNPRRLQIGRTLRVPAARRTVLAARQHGPARAVE